MFVDMGKITGSCATVQIHLERWCTWFLLCFERIVWIDDKDHPTIIYCTSYFIVTNMVATYFGLICIKPPSGCSNKSYKEENHIKLPIIIIMVIDMSVLPTLSGIVFQFVEYNAKIIKMIIIKVIIIICFGVA